MSLRKSLFSGVLWTAVQQFSTQGLNFIVSVILARILMPEEFGVIALLSVFVSIGNILINSGLSQSLIRTKDATQEDYSTVFIFNFLVSLLMYSIMYISAPVIANFYELPLITNVIRVYCLIFIVNSVGVIQNTKLTKDLKFKTQTLIHLPSIVLSSTLGIFMAYNDFGVWSLVWAAIAKSVIITLQLWIWSPWRPSLFFSAIKVKEHLSFGYKLGLSGILDALFKNIYTIIIGKFFNPVEVGYYNRAHTLRNLPEQNFSTILKKVTYPIFSKIQDDNNRLKSAYKKILEMSIFLIAPTLLFMGVLAKPLFSLVLTDKWLPAVPYFQILCVGGIIRPIHAFNLDILTVKGRSDLFLKLEIVKKIIVVFVIMITINMGVKILLIGSVISSIFMLGINSFYTGKFLQYNLWQQLGDILPTLSVACVSAAVVYLAKTYMLSEAADVYQIIGGFLLGGIVYFGLALLIKINSLLEVKRIIFKK